MRRAALILLVLLLSCRTQPPKDERPALVRVEVVVAERKPVRRTVTGAGICRGHRKATLSAQVGGVLQSLPYRVGDEVASGDTVAFIEDALYRANLRQARAALIAARGGLEKAERDMARAESLFAQAEVSASELEAYRLAHTKALSALLGARAGRERAELDLAHTRITAPFPGTIAAHLRREGELVAPGTPVLSLVLLDTIDVVISLSSLDVSKVRTGQRAVVTVPSLGGAVFGGSVAEVGPEADPRTRTFPVKVIVAEPRGLLRDGMVARAEIEVASSVGTILVPREAVVEEYGERVVYVVRGGRARRVRVRLGGEQGGMTQVVAGLIPGDSVVVVGSDRLREGTQVQAQAPAGRAQ